MEVPDIKSVNSKDHTYLNIAYVLPASFECSMERQRQTNLIVI